MKLFFYDVQGAAAAAAEVAIQDVHHPVLPNF